MPTLFYSISQEKYWVHLSSFSMYLKKEDLRIFLTSFIFWLQSEEERRQKEAIAVLYAYNTKH